MFLSRFKLYVFLLFGILAVIGGVCSTVVMSHTGMELIAPSNTEGYYGENMFKEYFKTASSNESLAIMFYVDPKKTPASCTNISDCPLLKTWEESFLVTMKDKYSDIVTGTNSFFSTCPEYNALNAKCIMGEQLLKPSKCYADKNCSHYMLDVTYTSKSDSHSYWLKLQKFLKEVQILVNKNDLPLSYSFLSMDVMFSEVEKAVMSDALTLNAISGAVAIVVVCIYLKSVAFLLILFASLLSSLLNTFIVLLPFCFIISVNSMAPTMSLATAVAFSIDYNLFILTRYKEELHVHKNPVMVAANIVHMCRHTVLISGLIIFICFLYNCFFQNQILTSCGVSASITIIFCVLSNLVLTPCILLQFHDFFSKCIDSDYVRISRHFNKVKENRENRENNENGIENNENLIELEQEHEERVSYKSVNEHHDHRTAQEIEAEYEKLFVSDSGCFMKLGHTLENKWISCVVLCVSIGLMVFPIYQTKNFNMSAANEAFLPYGTDTWNSYHSIENVYGSGALFPLSMVIKSDSDLVKSDAFFESTHDMVSKLYAETKDMSNAIVAGPSLVIIDGLELEIMYFDQQKCYMVPAIDPFWCAPEPIQSAVSGLVDQYASDNSENVAYFTVMTDVDLFSKNGSNYYNSYVAKMKKIAGYYEGYEVHVGGIAPGAIESLNATNDYFPTVILASILTATFIIAFTFKSVALPIIAVFFVGLMMGLAYGFATSVYVDGIFNGSNIQNISKFIYPEDSHGKGSISFMSASFDFPILVGLCVDYKVFLLNVIVELKQRGYSNKDSISIALHRTGAVVMTAGLIMMLAFGGLILSNVPSMQQIGFLLFVGVGIDAFFNNMVLLPCILYLIEDYSWYPVLYQVKGEPLQVKKSGIRGWIEKNSYVYQNDDTWEQDDVHELKKENKGKGKGEGEGGEGEGKGINKSEKSEKGRVKVKETNTVQNLATETQGSEYYNIESNENNTV